MYGAAPQPYGMQQQGSYRQAHVQPPMQPGYAGGPGYGQMPMYARQPMQQQRYPQQQGAYAGQPAQRGAGAGYVPAAGRSGQPYKGTIPPGQMVRVGNHTVRIERYLSEGGYAHVYLTSSAEPIYPPERDRDSQKKGRWGEKGYTEHCLKRIAFTDESKWAEFSKEIEVMKALPPSAHLIQYLDSSHHRLPDGTHEVFILMEFCSGGGIIDLLNKRLRDRLKEIEILNIFTDVCEAVAAMHAMKNPLLHRDLKIENVLSQPSGQPPSPKRPTPLIFKLCDFGSTVFPASHPPTSKQEADALMMDINKHTTLQYRSPEMVDPMLGRAIGLPSDVWALGVLLYKLCYYTTPFEEHGPLAIANAKYTFPALPRYSPRLQHLIASMLVEHPARRPTVFEVLKQAHEMSGTRPEVDYPTPVSSRRNTAALPPSPRQRKSQPSAGNLLDFTDSSPSQQAPPTAELSMADIIQPQRRGRPQRESMKATPPQVTSPPPSLPSTVPTGATAASQPKLQVTGDKSDKPLLPRLQSNQSVSKPMLNRLQSAEWKRSAPSPQGSVDAFGIPKQTSGGSTGSGFGDTFGMTKSPPVKSPISGFGDSFAVNATGPPPPSLPLRSQTGFSDAFGAPPRSATGFSDAFTGVQQPMQPSKPKPSSPQKSTAKISPTQTAQRRSPPASSIPNGELSFEQRYPSLEALDSGGKQPSPSSSPPVSAPPLAAPSAIRAKEQRRTSIVKSNLTGESKPYRLSVSSHPQPRSTHVTGTAFRDESLKPPQKKMDEVSPTADYLSLLDDEVESSKAPVDFMGDDEGLKVQLAPLRPTVSNHSSGSRFGVSPSATATAPAKPDQTPNKAHPTLPLSAARPATNINSDAWSPLEEARRPIRSQSPSPNGDGSSSDDDAPEPPTGTRGRSISPVKSGQPHPPSPNIKARMAAFQQQPSSSGFSYTVRQPTASARPQSMFVPSSPKKSPSPSSPEEKSHSRRSSINDMVSRYEQMSVKPESNGVPKKPKPAVASKPEALRKTQDKHEDKDKAAPAPAPKPKPAALRKATMEEPVKEPVKEHKPGPTPARKPSFKKSSSTASSPSASVFTSPPSAPVAVPTTVREERSRSRSSSPEKQAPVNDLIARWNRGQVKR